MYGRTVRGIAGEHFEELLRAARLESGASTDADLPAPELRLLVERYKKLFLQETGVDFPQDPLTQLVSAIGAVFASWNTERARVYRRQEHIDEDLGTAVNVMAMVFGNLGPTSGTGVAFTRDPATGARGCYGDYLSNAQGEDVVSGTRNAVPLQRLADLDRASFDELMRHMSTLERHYRDLCDIEFTIERGKLWMLQTRVGKRTAAAAFIIATQLVDEGLISEEEALRRVTGDQLAQLMFPGFDLTLRATAAGDRRRRVAWRRDRTGGLRQPPGRGGHRPRYPGAPGDQPGRPAWHDRLARNPHQPRRQDLTRRGGRPRDGSDLCLRRGLDRGRRGHPDRSRLTGRPSTRERSSPSTARRARSTLASCP